MRKKHEVGGKEIDFGNRPTVTIENIVIVGDTPKAWLVKRDGRKEKAVWVPRSCVQLNTHKKNVRLHDMIIPRDLAEEKGLLEGTEDESAELDALDALIAERKNRGTQNI